MKKKGFTLIELLVVISIIAMLLAILMPALSKVKRMAQRTVCGTNLKGLGTAQAVYANDYSDMYTRQGGRGTHTWTAGQVNDTNGWDNPTKDWANTSPITVGASLYLLVREADVSPKQFVCPSGGQQVFQGHATLDVTQLWDFGRSNLGSGPARCQSYAFHFPYGRNAADGSRSASFAILADRSPWFDSKILPPPTNAADWIGRVGNLAPHWNSNPNTWEIQRANSGAHGREGQQVVFADGHAEWARTPDVGVRNDQIYTPHGGGVDLIRQGAAGPYSFTFGSSTPTSREDSFLVGDDMIGQ